MLLMDVLVKVLRLLAPSLYGVPGNVHVRRPTCKVFIRRCPNFAVCPFTLPFHFPLTHIAKWTEYYLLRYM